MQALHLEKQINAHKLLSNEVSSIMREYLNELPDKLYYALADRRDTYEKKIESLTLEKIAAQKKEGKGINFTLANDALDSGFCRLYLRSEKKSLYCLQVGHHNRLELLICSKDGEPAYEIEDFYTIHNGQYCLDYFDIAHNEKFTGLRAADNVYKALTEYS